MVASVVTFAVVLAVVLVTLKLMGKPVKYLTAILINSILGAVILYLLHIFIDGIVVSWWSALITGIFGIPRSDFSCGITIIYSLKGEFE